MGTMSLLRRRWAKRGWDFFFAKILIWLAGAYGVCLVLLILLALIRVLLFLYFLN